MAGVYVLQQVVQQAALHGPLGQAFLWHGNVQFWPPFLFVINTDWMWRPWTLVTSTMSHSFGDIQHLVFNGLFLYFFGPAVERIVGARRFLLLFFAAGAVAGVAQVHTGAWMETGHPLAYGPFGGALGASGALMALFGVLMVLTPNQKVGLMMILPVPLWVAGILYAALDVLGVFAPSQVGHFAHLSGMALGLGYGWVLRERMRKRGLRLVY